MCTNIAGLIMTNGFSLGAIKEWGMQMCRNSSLLRSLSEVIILSILTVDKCDNIVFHWMLAFACFANLIKNVIYVRMILNLRLLFRCYLTRVIDMK